MLKNNWLKIAVLIMVLIVGSSIFYYFAISLPAKDIKIIKLQQQENVANERREQEAKEETEKRTEDLNNCIWGAGYEYTFGWLHECEKLNLLSQACISERNKINDSATTLPYDDWKSAIINKSKTWDSCSCKLPHDIATNLDTERKDARNECYLKYPPR